MKISREIQFWKDVDIEITTEDIQMLLVGDEGKQKLLNSMNEMAQFMNGISDSLINELSEEQKTMVHDFFIKVADRF